MYLVRSPQHPRSPIRTRMWYLLGGLYGLSGAQSSPPDPRATTTIQVTIAHGRPLPVPSHHGAPIQPQRQNGRDNQNPEGRNGLTAAILEAAYAVLPEEEMMSRMPEWCPLSTVLLVLGLLHLRLFSHLVHVVEYPSNIHGTSWIFEPSECPWNSRGTPMGKLQGLSHVP